MKYMSCNLQNTRIFLSFIHLYFLNDEYLLKQTAMIKQRSLAVPNDACKLENVTVFLWHLETTSYSKRRQRSCFIIRCDLFMSKPYSILQHSSERGWNGLVVCQPPKSWGTASTFMKNGSFLYMLTQSKSFTWS